MSLSGPSLLQMLMRVESPAFNKPFDPNGSRFVGVFEIANRNSLPRRVHKEDKPEL